MNWNNKRILITQPMMHWICGSTVVTLELAEFLQSQGAKVIIYTCFYGEPLKSICKKKKIVVEEFNEKPEYKLSDFDFIWIHSQVLPISIVRQLGKTLPKKIPKFIFLHMSGMDWIPDEKPWIYDLENRISSKSLFICEEVEDTNNGMLDTKLPKGYFRNPAPLEYYPRKTNPKKKLRDILIVSNHPPEEILKARDILINKYHLNVEMLGEQGKMNDLISVEILEKYDAIITIAKTVSYCLISGTPVYVYDTFSGGVGWLNDDNFTQAKYRNFSGYQNKFYESGVGGGFEKKDADEIVEEIINGYNDALKFHDKKQNLFQKEFALDRVLPNILKDVKIRDDIVPFSKRYEEAVIAAQLFAERRFESGSVIHNLAYDVRHLDQRIRELEIRLRDEEKEKQEIFNSRSYRFFKKMIEPYVLLRKQFKKM